MLSKRASKPLSNSEYMALAEFRYQIRKYLRHMEEKAREFGHNPQQYQLLLAVKGLPKGLIPSVGALAERMQLNHNSMVELVDRCQRGGLLLRSRAGTDRRQVMLEITPAGQRMMRRYARATREELDIVGPVLAESIHRLLHAREAPNTSHQGSR